VAWPIKLLLEAVKSLNSFLGAPLQLLHGLLSGSHLEGFWVSQVVTSLIIHLAGHSVSTAIHHRQLTGSTAAVIIDMVQTYAGIINLLL